MKLLGHLLSLCGSFSSSREPGSAASNHAIISVRPEPLSALVAMLTATVWYVYLGADPPHMVLKLSRKTCFGSKRTFLLRRPVLQFQILP